MTQRTTTINYYQAIQKDVRAALGKEGNVIPKQSIGKRKQELDYPHELRGPDPKPHYIKQHHWKRIDRAVPNKTKERVAMMNVLKPRWM